jgi:sulfonate transport system permease protein
MSVIQRLKLAMHACCDGWHGSCTRTKAPRGTRMTTKSLHGRIWRTARTVVPFAAVVGLWYWATERHAFPPELLVPPARVWHTFLELLRGDDLKTNLLISLQRLALGVGAGAVGGIVLGIAMASSDGFDAFVRPSFNLIRQVPAVALIPVFILMFGIGETFKVLIIAKAALFPIALAAYQGVRGIPAAYADVARVYELPRGQWLRRVVIPATLPELVTGLRIALGRSWATLMVAELLAAESGLGQMIQYAREMFRMDIVLVGIVVIGLVGFGLDRLVKLGERGLTHWRPA